MSIFDSIGDVIGNTPIVKLSRFGSGLKHNLLGKCEFLNPGGSIKDRIAFRMVELAEHAGKLKSGSTIVEATAGNTGIGLAMVAALKGYKLVTVMSEKVSKDKVRLLKKLGAETVIVPSGLSASDPENFKNKAASLAEERGWWLADQFNNSDNIVTHYELTGPEIWRQTEGKIDALVAGVGTGGTMTGAGKYLKEQNKNIKLVLADPFGSTLAGHIDGSPDCAGSYVVEGIGGDCVPLNFHTDLIDAVVRVTDDESIQTAYELMQREAMFVGSSSGCIAWAALKYCHSLEGAGKNVVAILPDGGRAYMSTIYDDDWLKSKSLMGG